MIPRETTLKYFALAVQYAQYGKLINYNQKGEKTGVNNLKYAIKKLSWKYFKDSYEYKDAAAISIGGKDKDILNHGAATRSFKTKIDTIL